MFAIRACTVFTLLAATLATGCSVRDEQAVDGAETRWWSSAAGSGGAGLIAGPPATPARTAVIEYVEGFDAGTRRATDAGLPMLVVFRAAWCRWSGELVQAAVADPRVVEFSRRFVCVAIDADRHQEACRAFEVHAFPTVILLDAGRTERFRATGSSAASGLAAAMGDVLASPNRPNRMASGPSTPVQ
ncbi:MAG: thioredoxin family protein [Planctomycetia bacterium]|nr:thioredoxin family protein [Planctomycetia bacterium]